MASPKIATFGFSGAGFLTCYHLGAAKCLLEHGYLVLGGEHRRECRRRHVRQNVQILTGVSGGALTTAALFAGIDPEEGMQTTLQLARRTREEHLDAFQPGFSLLDQLEVELLRQLKSAMTTDDDDNDDNNDNNMVLEGRGCRIIIGLTNRFVFPPIRNPRAYCYVDEFRNVQDLVAACIMSSYIPGVTGPMMWKSSPTIVRASRRLREMTELGFVKRPSPIPGLPPQVVRLRNKTGTSSKERMHDDDPMIFLDGGISNGFPVIDHKTVLVTPIAGVFDPNPSICPQSKVTTWAKRERTSLVQVSDRVKLFLSPENAQTLRRIVLSSDDCKLEDRYAQGYEDAERFLSLNNLTSTYSVYTRWQQPHRDNQSSSIEL